MFTYVGAGTYSAKLTEDIEIMETAVGEVLECIVCVIVENICRIP